MCERFFFFKDVCRGGKHCLRWSNPESTYSRTFDYPRDNAYDMPVAIKVRSPGIYFVYAQVAVNGPQQGYIHLKMIFLLRGLRRLKSKIRDVDRNMKFTSIHGLKVNIEISLSCFNSL